MSYIKQIFKKKQELKAEHLNHMETGIAEAMKIAERAYKKTENIPDLKDGKSAYEYAREAGYVGTEKEFSHKLAVPIIIPEMFGAVGDGVTDDSEAIQNAIDAAGSNQTVYLAKKKYAISTSLTITNRYANFVCDGEIIYSGTDSAITLSNVDCVNLQVYVIRAENGTALLLDSTDGAVSMCTIDIKHIRESKIGVHLKGDGATSMSGNTIFYNKFHLEGSIQSTDTCVYIEAVTALVNENWFWLGRLYGGAMYGIRINSTNNEGSNGNASRNVFFSGDIEGISGEGCAVYMHNSSNNVIQDARCEEGYGKNCIAFSGVCSGNDIRLSLIDLEKVDISNFTGGSRPNILRSTRITVAGSYSAGDIAHIDYRNGFSYDSKNANISIGLSTNTFADNDIKMLEDRSIPTTINAMSSALNGKIFTLNRIYSEYTSLTKGCPVVFYFGDSTMGKILLKDNRGGTILDNTDGKYAEKTVSVRWNGYNKQSEEHIWDVQVLGETVASTEYVQEYAQPKGDYALESDIPTKTSELINDSGFLTQHQNLSGYATETYVKDYAQPKGSYLTSIPSEYVTETELTNKGYADKSSAETWTFTLKDGTTVTKKVVLA